MRPQVNGELAGVSAGVGAYLTLEGSFIVVDTEMLFQTACVGCRVRAVFTLVRLLSSVHTAVEIQFISTTESLVTEFTLKRSFPCEIQSDLQSEQIFSQQKRQIKQTTYQCVLKYVSPCLFGHTEF